MPNLRGVQQRSTPVFRADCRCGMDVGGSAAVVVFHEPVRAEAEQISSQWPARAFIHRCCRPPHKRGGCRPLGPVVPMYIARAACAPVFQPQGTWILLAPLGVLDSGGRSWSDAQRAGAGRLGNGPSPAAMAPDLPPAPSGEDHLNWNDEIGKRGSDGFKRRSKPNARG